MALRCVWQTLKKKYKLSVKLSVTFFSEQSVGMTLAQRYTESDTPLIGKQSVAAAHLQATAYAADLPRRRGVGVGRDAPHWKFRGRGGWGESPLAAGGPEQGHPRKGGRRHRR